MGMILAIFICSGTVPVIMDVLIRVEIGPDMLLAINLIGSELILSSLQLVFGFSDFIISKISLESVELKKNVLLFCFLFNCI